MTCPAMAPNHSRDLTLALAAKYQGLVTRKSQRLVLWLPLHRTPSPNKLLGRLGLVMKEKREAKQALLNASARVSTSPFFGFGS